ncbi:Lrp/AsnC family transcriptional regulator [Candidatus Woesearchaeota archaeon]|nr:Lrp/AsnC family transcriptional regulator [Candidatus Woesearchaeota archaeon]
MDEIDIKIVNILQKDGRINYNEIARRLKLANATIHARIIKLLRRKIIDGFSANVNPRSVGKSLSFFLSLSIDHTKDDPQQTINAILKMSDVADVYCVTGDWDYHVLIHTKDADSMKKIITEEIKQQLPHVIRSSAQIVLDRGEKPISLKQSDSP